MNSLYREPIDEDFEGDLVFQILDWYPHDEEEVIEDIDEYIDRDIKTYTIRVFGISETGISISAKIIGFKPYFFVKVPDKWNIFNKRALVDFVKKKVGRKYHSSISFEYLERCSFRGFTDNKKFKFIKFKFKNSYIMRRCKYVFDRKISLLGICSNRKFELYESNIPPFLRFIHKRNIRPAGWVFIKDTHYKQVPDNKKETRCQLEFEIKYKKVYPADKDDIGPLIISSFDIEADSSHGDFPLAKKTYQKLAYDIIYKLYDIKRTFVRNKLFRADIKFKSIKEIDSYAKSQAQFESLCKANLHAIIKVMLLKAFYETDYLEYDLTYKLGFLLDDIHHVFIKHEKDTELNIVNRTINTFLEQVIEEAQKFLPYINMKNNTKEVKVFKDCVRELKHKYLPQEGEHKEIFDLVEIIKSKAMDKCEIFDLIENVKSKEIDNGRLFKQSENVKVNYNNEKKNDKKKKKIPYYYKDLLSKLINRTYLVKQLDIVISRFFPPVEGDKVIQIGTTSNRYGEKDCFLKHIITLDTCDKIDGVEVVACKTEAEVLLEWMEFINQLLPDVIIGYNTFGFDFAYMYHRAEELGIEDKFARIGRMLNKPSCLINKKLASSALGENDMYYIDMTGIILIDLLKVVRTGHKLASYKLDNVAKHFIGCQKDDVSPKQIFEYQKKDSYHRAIIAKYCVQDCALCNNLASKLDVISNNIGMANVCSVPLTYIFLRGQGIKIFSLVAKECLAKKYLLPVLPRIKDKKKDQKKKKKYFGYSNKDNTDKEEDEDCSFEGAIVLEPKIGVYFDPVSVLDYSSLYPSSIISENLSHETYCIDKKYLGDKGKTLLKKMGYDVVDITFNRYKPIDPEKPAKGKKKVGDRTCRFVQYPDKNGEEQKGIIPNILKKLLIARKKTRAKIKIEKDEFKKSVLDGLQLAYKITANSLYGQIGARTSNVRWIDIAACTTAIGRELVMLAKDKVEELVEGSEVIYGDTDSVFVKFKLEDENGVKIEGEKAVEKAIEVGLKFEKEVKHLLKSPHNLEYEKTFWPFVLLSKKRYVGNKYEFNTKKYKQTSMGIVLKRRDNADIVKHVYGGVIDIIINKKNIELSKEFLRTTLMELINGKYGLDMLVITKSLRGNYKNPQSMAHKVLADRMGERDPGNKPQVNDRIPYVYINVPEVKGRRVLQGNRIEHPQFIKDNQLKPDYKFYITNQIMVPVSQVFALVMDKPEELFRESLRVATNRKNNVKDITQWFRIKSKT